MPGGGEFTIPAWNPFEAQSLECESVWKSRVECCLKWSAQKAMSDPILVIVCGRASSSLHQWKIPEIVVGLNEEREVKLLLKGSSPRN